MHHFGYDNAFIQDISEVVLSACSSLFEMYAGLYCKQCRYRDVEVIKYLVHNAGFHHLRLLKLMSAIPHCRSGDGHPIKASSSEVIDKAWKSLVKGNKFHMLMFHLSEAKLKFGANLNTIDTQETEGKHKTFVKQAYLVSYRTIYRSSRSFYFCFLTGDVKKIG